MAGLNSLHDLAAVDHPGSSTAVASAIASAVAATHTAVVAQGA